ncbi:kelch-like protein 38 [Clavelina lepadiformis]|uniref:kelch-like protein 38 n=1 Tax=Clavelina lepadiformis TaxID=159417 RepID=UPI0040432505
MNSTAVRPGIPEESSVNDVYCKHAVSLLEKLNRDRKSGQELCDVTICIEQQEWLVHKCVIGVFSDFYKKVFTTHMQEKYDGKATMKGVSIAIMEAVINYLYTGDISLNDNNVYDFLDTAEYLQIPDIKDCCIDFLLKNLTPGNCLSISMYGSRYNNEELMKKAEDFFNVSFALIVEGQQFKDLNYDDVVAILQRNSRKISSELKYKALIGWIKHKPDQREKFFPQLFKYCDIGEMSFAFLQNISENEDFVKRSLECTQNILQLTFKQLSKINISTERKEAKYLSKNMSNEILVLGDWNSGINATKYNIANDTWTKFPNMNFKHHSATAVKKDNTVYVMGGGELFRGSRKVEKINLKKPHKWIELSDMCAKRSGASAIVHGDRIFVVEGYYGDGTTEYFDISQNSWTLLKNMSLTRFNFGLVSCQGFLYAMGDYHSADITSMQRFDLENIEIGWKYVCSMAHGRGCLAAVALNNEIYAIGGRDCKTGCSLSVVEKYSPKTDTWCQVASMNEARKYHCACVVGSKIFVVGGEHRVSIESNDPATDQWSIEARMEEPRDHCCVVAI